MYDYLVVGAGLYGSIFAYEAHKKGKKVLVIDKRNHLGGNLYTKKIEGINVHIYGAHIFHTSSETVWQYINQFLSFNNYINSPLANYKGEIYNLPFNMNTFSKMWGITKPSEAKQIIEQQRKDYYKDNPKNLEEQAINLVGTDIYEKLVKGYTEKQWGKSCQELLPYIIKRLPVRFTYNNNYFNDKYQGIPVGGYTQLFDQLLEGIDVILNVDYLKDKDNFDKLAKKVLYTGPIDLFYNYQLGKLDYRSLYFEQKVVNVDNYQGNAVINYTDRETPYTRIIEHKHFEFVESNKTVITKEYPCDYTGENEPYYPINDSNNNQVYESYNKKASQETKYLFGGRLAEYKYYNMDDIIEKVLILVQNELG
jgi:UDP-galactopyranose mutase